MLVCFLFMKGNAQLNFDFTEGKFLIKGKVIDVQTKKTIGNANIRVNGTNKGFSCDGDGKFAFYVRKSDTLKFSSTGYLSKIVHVHDLDSTQHYTLEIQLIHDFVKLKEVTIYPYHNLEEFKQAFVDAKDVNKISIYGYCFPPKFGTKIPKAKFSNPVSFFIRKAEAKFRLIRISGLKLLYKESFRFLFLPPLWQSIIVSARKYRPARFSEMVGQEQVATTLKKCYSHRTLVFVLRSPRCR